MLLFCPLCQASFPGTSRCPRCGGLLYMPTETTADATRGADPDEFERPGPAARLGVGVVLGLGLFLGLRQVVSAALLAAGPAAPWWLTLDGLAAVYTLHAAAAAFGGLIAAAGRHRGFPYGLAVGGACGALFLAAEALTGAPVLQPLFLLQLPVLAAAGGLAGVAGSRIWAPVPELDIKPLVANKLSSVNLGVEPEREVHRPTQFLRVLAGAAVMAVGFAFADDARHFVQKRSGGFLQTESVGQGKFLSWQLATVLVLVGGAVAGAGTGAGLRHGCLAGLLGGFATVGLIVGLDGKMSPQTEFQFAQLALYGVGPLEPAGIAGIVGSLVMIGLVGGWLGAQLYLPLAAPNNQSRRLKMMD
jgi:hypothetical protein